MKRGITSIHHRGINPCTCSWLLHLVGNRVASQTAILFGAILSSTDTAAVFGIIESKQIKLKHNTGTILEFESATNDHIAPVLFSIFAESAMGGSEDAISG